MTEISKKLYETLKLVRSMRTVEALSPAAHEFEKEKRAEAWDKIDAEITAALVRAEANAGEPVDGMSPEDENYLQEIADGAWGDDPRTRGVARDRLASHPAPQPSGWEPEVGNRFIAGVNPEGQPRAWLRLDDMPSVGSVIEMLEEWERTDPKRRLVITDSVERTFPAEEGGDDD